MTARGPVPRQVGDLDDLAVGRGDDLAADRPDPGDPQGDVLHRAGDRLRYAGYRDADDVAEAELPLPGDEQPGADVLDESLQAETQRGAEQGGRRDQPGQRHAQVLDDQHRGDDVEDGQHCPGDHLRDDVTVLGGLRPHQFVGLARMGVDVLHDPATRPFRQPGGQDRPEHQQHDHQQVAARPPAQVIQRSDSASQYSPPV